MSRTYGNFTDFVDFSRASSATYLGSDGLIQTASNNIPRVEYDASGNVKGLLIEEARTNLVTYSEDFSQSYWSKANSGITSDAAIAPDGTLTGTKLYATAINNYHNLNRFAAYPIGSSEFTFSVFLKAGESTKARLGIVPVNPNDFSNDASANIDLSAGAIQSATRATASITDVGNGWYYCTVASTQVTASSSTDVQAAVILVDDSYNQNFTGNGESGIYVWGAQLEEGSFATSYIPTSGATAARSADIASIDVDQFGYSKREGSVLVEFSAYSWETRADSSNYSRVWEFNGNGAGGDGVFRDAFSGDIIRYRFNENDGSTAAIGPANLDQVTGTHKVCVALGQDDAAISMDGGTVATGSGTAAMDIYSGIQIGGTGVNAMGGHIRNIKYYPRRLTNAQLQEITS